MLLCSAAEWPCFCCCSREEDWPVWQSVRLQPLCQIGRHFHGRYIKRLRAQISGSVCGKPFSRVHQSDLLNTSALVVVTLFFSPLLFIFTDQIIDQYLFKLTMVGVTFLKQCLIFIFPLQLRISSDTPLLIFNFCFINRFVIASSPSLWWQWPLARAPSDHLAFLPSLPL